MILKLGRKLYDGLALLGRKPASHQPVRDEPDQHRDNGAASTVEDKLVLNGRSIEDFAWTRHE